MYFDTKSYLKSNHNYNAKHLHEDLLSLTGLCLFFQSNWANLEDSVY